MIKRTPQEIADFTGCYVAKAKGRTKLLFLYEKRPPLTDNWSHLYEPRITHEKRMKNAQITHDVSSSDKQASKTSDEATHISEVYTHKEYVLAEGKRVQDLTNKVNILLAHGWKPQGGIFVEYLPESDGYAESTEFYYQAMVRGL